MVKLEELVELDSDNSSDWESQHSDHEDDDAASVTSDSSVSSSGSVLEESFYERMSALIDIIPPTTRINMRDRVLTTWRRASTVWGWMTYTAWVLSTSALMVGVPLAIQMEREVATRQWEQDMQKQNPQASSGGASGYTGGLGPPALSSTGIPAGF